MKPTLLSLCAVSLLFFLPLSGSSQLPDNLLNQPSTSYLLKQRMQQPVTLPDNASPDWYSQAMKVIEDREYNVRAATETGQPQFGAVNRANRAGFLFTPSGYRFKGIDFDNELAERWEAALTIKGIGRGNQLMLRPDNPSATGDGHLITYRYAGFTVEYLNDHKGVRQNFIVHTKPAGNDELRVSLQLEGDLVVRQAGPQKLFFQQKGFEGTAEMVYDGLKVWDANYRPLTAHLEATTNNEIRIVVDDRDAVYPITIDPLSHTPSWTDSGDGLLFPLLSDLSAHVLYGTSVSGAGKLNAAPDLYDDVIVGAPGYVQIGNISGGIFNLVSVGAAFVYFGSATGLSITPNEVLQPSSLIGAMFGFSVSKAGDVNNDGRGDVVIGAPGDRVTISILGIPTLFTLGRAHVYYGTAFDGNVNTQPTPSVSLNLPSSGINLVGAVANPLFGFSVSNAGDVNGDGISDIVVGSPAYVTIGIPTTLGGRIDIFHGGAGGISTTSSHNVVGSLVGGLFGFSVSTAGKVNADAFDDIIAGAPASLLALGVGGAYVFHGSATGITATTVAGANINLSPPGILSGTLFGFSVSDAGDVNGDGRGDVIVGQPLALELFSGSIIAVGKATIFYGSPSGVVTSSPSPTELTSPRTPGILGLIQGNLLYGYSVSGGGDLNGDGFADVIVGEPGGTSLGLSPGLGLISANVISGRVYVYYGRPTTGLQPGPFNSPFLIVRETNNIAIANFLGFSVSDAGDVNGDGKADFVIGSPNGTLNMSASITGIVGSALGFLTTNSIGSAYTIGDLAAIDLDFDNDGVPNVIDLDDDNDGTPDLAEYPGMGLTQDPAGDADGDGVPNYMDPEFLTCGGLNSFGICVNFDKDGDGLPNSFDLDCDNDGASDVVEAGGVDMDGDGIQDNFGDTDSDGLTNILDATPATGTAGSGTGLPPVDFDGDGIPNNFDKDSDGDGISDLRENGFADTDNNGRIDGFADTDGDGLADAIDPKNGHSGPLDPAGTGTAIMMTPSDGATVNGRYEGNPVPVAVNADADAKYNFVDSDSDNDGITDNVEVQTTTGYIDPTAADTDGDGMNDVYGAGGVVPNNHDALDDPDYLDADTDNDSQIDRIEGHDLNSDGMPNDDVSLTGTDTDGDGIDDKFDSFSGFNGKTAGIGTGPFGSLGPLQQSPLSATDRDWRNAAFVLPVTLVEFTGKKAGNAIQLDWKTATESNSSHFEIERSTDGRSFTSIGEVAAAGNSNTLRSYSFHDKLPAPNNNYYRLKIVDLDGRSALSKVVVIRTGSAGRGIFAYPNPVRDQIQLTWEDMPAAEYTIDILHTGGQLMQKSKIRITSSSQVTVIPRNSSWRSGVYLIRVSGGGEQKLIKVLIE